MKLRELLNRQWAKDKKTRELDNKRILTGRRKGQFFLNGQPRGEPLKLKQRLKSRR